jgi:hypothetical protein
MANNEQQRRTAAVTHTIDATHVFTHGYKAGDRDRDRDRVGGKYPPPLARP